MKKTKKRIISSLPSRLLSPIREFLEKQLIKTKRMEKKLKKEDPFASETRTSENSFEEDLDEQIGHFDNEIKIRFLSKQIAQLRMALTRMKIGKYGICQKCGKMIDTDRLAIKPEAITCVKCSKKSEE